MWAARGRLADSVSCFICSNMMKVDTNPNLLLVSRGAKTRSGINQQVNEINILSLAKVISLIEEDSVMLYAIWYHLHNLKNVKNTHEGVLLLAKLQAFSLQLYQE